ncbi:hypothetical protein IQ247_25205 [Plectonema cf. radiosum LEGE 06105]|uniref:Uncharacterized protein n=1 Tax=Plectonema cf. radiosum LEGE 06105 TaxID=945769 RepID=A0A8J7JWR6_9CYAN|nr:DUF6335 family protein [Plectonema radiosum]MBE9215920.1 hypothetical protein [Plectonema cf. radiosum LEGE 06105]
MSQENINNQAEISDLPQEITESYGTGVSQQPGMNIGGRVIKEQKNQHNATSPELTGGDVDAYWEDANSVGDEAVGGTVATPDQNVTEELGKAVGLEMDDRQPLQTNDILDRRDDNRWELDPKSSEDYQNHSK